MKKHKFISVKFKITILSIFLVIFCTVSIGGYILIRMPSIIINSVGKDYMNIMKSISNTIDKDKLARIKPTDKGNDFHKGLSNELGYIKDVLGLDHLYVLKKDDKGDFFELTDDNGDAPDAVSGATPTIEAQSVTVTDAMKDSFDGSERFELQENTEWGRVFSLYLPLKQNNDTIGILVANLSGDSIFNEFYTVRKQISSIAIGILAIGVLIAVVFSIILVASVKKLQVHVEKLQSGNLSLRLPKLSNDEIGLLGKSFNKMSDILSGMVIAIRDKSGRLNYSSGRLSAISQNIAKASEETVSSISEIASGASEQANELAIIREALQNFNETVKEIYASLNTMKRNIKMTENLTQNGNLQLQQLIGSIESSMDSFKVVSDRINELSVDVQQIDEINQAIQSISQQTNLLALNAAIEAARAGESGKGFTVVADEIRNLAEQSKDSTDKIRLIIDGIMSRVESVVVTNNEVREKISRQFEYVDITNDAFKNMESSIAEALPALEQTFMRADDMIKSKDYIVEKIELIAAVSQQTSAGAQEILATSEIISDTTQDIAETSKTLHDLSDDLLKEINQFVLE